MKNWTYAEITKRTEKLIIQNMNKARKETVPSLHSQRQDWAFGAYLLWEELCQDEIIESDSERLGALVTSLHRPDMPE